MKKNIGVPREIKSDEERVAITPGGVELFRKNGNEVVIEKSAGEGSGFSDEEYKQAGAKIMNSASEVYSSADLVLKVKEPQEEEYEYLREDLIIFTFLHLSANPSLAKALLKKKSIGISYDTVQNADGHLPLLAPMSEVAGKMAVQKGAQYLEKPSGGTGILLGGIPGVLAGNVVIIGGGMVGVNAARVALGMGARVSVLDIDANKLRQVNNIFDGQVNTIMSNSKSVEESVINADLLIGAVLIPGSQAPKVVKKEMVEKMKKGSVIVDVAIDQGGCIETCDQPTTHSNPVIEKYGVLHYSVANIPGAVPRTSTLALTNVTLSYGLEIADKGLNQAIKEDQSLAKGLNTYKGYIVNETVANSLGYDYTPIDSFELKI
ncbi:MAG: alanine dehydrogenase [Bacillota bacterium]